jgi:hypothetical protein
MNANGRRRGIEIGLQHQGDLAVSSSAESKEPPQGVVFTEDVGALTVFAAGVVRNLVSIPNDSAISTTPSYISASSRRESNMNFVYDCL